MLSCCFATADPSPPHHDVDGSDGVEHLLSHPILGHQAEQPVVARLVVNAAELLANLALRLVNHLTLPNVDCDCLYITICISYHSRCSRQWCNVCSEL